jgi:hypothetical protein
MPPLTRARKAPTAPLALPGPPAPAAAEAPPTLLDARARAPAAAALVIGALDRAADRRALRLAHPQLRAAVGEATTRLRASAKGPAAARAPTPARWPRLRELAVSDPDAAALKALAAEGWGGALRTLRLDNLWGPRPLDARALAAALRAMPALRALELGEVPLGGAAAAELLGAARAAAARQRVLSANRADLSPEGARALAATGWRLEALDLSFNGGLGAAGVAALAAAPTFALRRLKVARCGLDAGALLGVANAPWPLEELDLATNDLRAAEAAPARRRARARAARPARLEPEQLLPGRGRVQGARRGRLASADLPRRVLCHGGV